MGPRSAGRTGAVSRSESFHAAYRFLQSGLNRRRCPCCMDGLAEN